MSHPLRGCGVITAAQRDREREGEAPGTAPVTGARSATHAVAVTIGAHHAANFYALHAPRLIRGSPHVWGAPGHGMVLGGF